MTKEETLALLDKSGIKYERFDHRAIFTVEEGEGIDFPHPEAGTKNLFVHDDKKQHFYLITICEHKRVDLKAFAAENGLRKLSFGSEEELWRYLALRPGSVRQRGRCTLFPRFRSARLAHRRTPMQQYVDGIYDRLRPILAASRRGHRVWLRRYSGENLICSSLPCKMFL